MDSFYDAPRRAPVPTQVEKFLARPMVPEVSILSPSKPPNNAPYNSWKMQQNQMINGGLASDHVMKSPQNFNYPSQVLGLQNSSQILKKQVRFESPVLQQRPSLTYEPFARKDSGFLNNSQTYRKSVLPCQEKLLPTTGLTEQIYMANVPNRHLDLSIIDLPQKARAVEKSLPVLEEATQRQDEASENEGNNKENELPKTYREFLETQKNIPKQRKASPDDSIIDLFNYKKKKELPYKKLHVSPTPREVTRTRNNLETNLSNDLPQQRTAVDLNKPTNYSPVHTRNEPQILQNQNRIKSTTTYTYPDHFLQNPNKNHDESLIKCDSVTQTSTVYSVPQETSNEQTSKSNDVSEPSNKDLLKIIAQQNEQLLILQKQVAMLLNRDQAKQIEPAPQQFNYVGEKCITSTQNENALQDINATPRKRGLSKFSIDLMTSFEVAIRPQHNKQNFINHEPKIQEITESDGATSEYVKDDKTVVDTSIQLRDSVKVQETCPSPEPSININMNDYESSDDDEATVSEIGATFYKNLMGQVNNILKKAQIQTKEDLVNKEYGKNGAVADKTLARVKETTLKHLRNIGVTIGPLDDIEEMSSEDIKDHGPREISFAVKQLLLKYLPDDQLAKITYKQARSVPVGKDDKPDVIPGCPEFSFASVQYMKKYNLIPTTSDSKPRDERVSRPSRAPKADIPKILDITALKMQPKLL